MSTFEENAQLLDKPHPKVKFCKISARGLIRGFLSTEMS